MKNKEENTGRVTVRLPARHLAFLDSTLQQNSSLIREALDLLIRQKGGEL